MRDFIEKALLGWLVAGGLVAAPASAQALPPSRPATAPPANDLTRGRATPPGGVTPATDPAAIGRKVLNAGPDPRVQWDGLSRDQAALFGTRDEDEQALLANEQALQRQRDQLHLLERLLTHKPAAADPPALIPLNTDSSMNRARLAPTPSGSQLDNGAAQRSVDRMQRRVDDLRSRLK